MKAVVVTFALAAEAQGFCRRLSARRKDKMFVRGQLGETSLAVCFVGMQALRLSALRSLLLQVKPSFLLSSGFAGGLRTLLRPGDFLLARNYSTPELGEAVRASPIFDGAGDFAELAIVADTTLKRKMNENSEFWAVDLESGPIFTLCQELSIPLVTARMISDGRDELIPDLFLGRGFRRSGELWAAAKFAGRMLVLRERLGRKLVKLTAALTSAPNLRRRTAPERDMPGGFVHG